MRLRTAWMAALLAAFLAVPASAYYHFYRYTSRTAPFTPIPEKFDLNALPAKTVMFFVSDTGPVALSPSDSFASVLSQVAAAARAWNSVDSSDLRVGFGGLASASTIQSTAGGDIVFEELPPGFLGFGGPAARGDVTTGPNGPFVPITRSVIRLNRDLTQRPSQSDGFFLTVVHEMGHALGLQHTATSSVMSTERTRSTSRFRPIEADDIAGISILYPGARFAGSTGSIAGRVTAAGQGVHLASVVALRPAAPAISALTQPDGSYRIDGLPPGQYFLYVHPLPAPLQAGLGPLDVVLPLDPDANRVAASPVFDTVFFPSTRDVQQATPISVAPGQTADGFNFSVTRAAAQRISDISIFSFFGNNPVQPGFVNMNQPVSTLVARGTGISVGSVALPGLTIQAIGGSARLSATGIRPYGGPPAFLALDFQPGLIGGTGPRHLLFTTADDIFVMPSAMNLVGGAPPVLSAASTGFDPSGNRSVIITGSNLSAETQVFFDGFPAPARTYDEASGRIFAQPPVSPGGYRAAITLANPDGQSSGFTSGSTPVTVALDGVTQPSLSINPPSLRAGSEAMLEIIGSGINFVDGQITAGFGSRDIFVRRMWVTGPNRVLLNVSVAPTAPSGPVLFSLQSGLQIVSQPGGFTIDSPNPRLPVVSPAIQNTLAGVPQLFAGSAASLFGSNLNAGGSPAVTVGDRPATILFASANQIDFQIPSGLPLGPTTLRLNNGVDGSYPVVIQIDPLPAIVTSLLSSSNNPVDSARPARVGETITLSLNGLADVGTAVAASRVRVTVGGFDQPVLAVTPAATGHQVLFAVGPTAPTGQPTNVQVFFDGRASLPIGIIVR